MSRLTIVGAGRVGKTLGNLIVANRRPAANLRS